MLVYSDSMPQEMEFLQGGILVRWDIKPDTNTPDKHTEYTYQEIGVGLDNIKEQITFALANSGYTDSCNDFADRIIAFRDAK